MDRDGPVPSLCPDLGPCWIWTLSRNPVSGYGQVYGGPGRSRMLLAHRVAYELVKGPIGPGLTVDHLCNVRVCVNPAHLDLCSIGVNSSRGADRRLTCKRGHSWGPSPYVHPSGYRRCRQCNTEAARARRELRAGQAQFSAETGDGQGREETTR